MAQLRKGTTYATGDQVTATNINNLVDNAILLNGAITEQPSGTAVSTDTLLVAGASDLKKVTVSSLLGGLVKTDGTVAMTAELSLANSTPSVALAAASKGYVDSAVSAGIPTGAVMAFFRSSAPSGWLECNGQSTSGYTALAAIIGANVPDLRGRFIKGLDGSRSINSYEADALGSHTHTASSAAHTHSVSDPTHNHTFSGGSHTHSINDPSHWHYSYEPFGQQYAGSDGQQSEFATPKVLAQTTAATTGITINAANTGGSNSASGTGISIGSTAASVTVTATGGTETTPKNVALMYCIKT